jgi:hypothetical protein
MSNTSSPHLSPEFFTRMQGKTLDAFAVLTEMNHRILQGLVGLTAAAAKEGLRTYAELQTATVDAARAAETPAGADGGDEAAPGNPFAWYQKGLLTLVDGTQRAFRLAEANAQVVTRTAQRIQASTEQTGHEIQEVLTTSATRLKEIYARS